MGEIYKRYRKALCRIKEATKKIFKQPPKSDPNDRLSGKVVLPASSTPIRDKTAYLSPRPNVFEPLRRSKAGRDDLSPFKHRMTPRDRFLGLQLLHVLDIVFKKAKIEWCLIYGTLAGQHHFHGPTPWDDDWDVLVFAPRATLIQVLSKFAEMNRKFGFWEGHAAYSKLYHSFSANAGEKEWKWPFVDIFYGVVDSKAKTVAVQTFPEDSFREGDVFPLKKGFFEGLLFPVPADTAAVVKRMYKGKFGECCKAGYDHKNEKWGDIGRKKREIDCSALRKAYGWVYRHIESRDGRPVAVETLRRADRVLHRVEIQEISEKEDRFVLFC